MISTFPCFAPELALFPIERAPDLDADGLDLCSWSSIPGSLPRQFWSWGGTAAGIAVPALDPVSRDSGLELEVVQGSACFS